MVKLISLKLWVTTGLSYLLIQSLPISLSIPSPSKADWYSLNSTVMAKSSGGRSRGGSFRSFSGSSRKKSSSSPASRRSSSTKSSSYPAPFRSGRYDRRDRYATSIAIGSRSTNSQFLKSVILIGLVIGTGIVIFIGVYTLLSTLKNRSHPQSKMERERDNSIVTVSKLQVALLAYAGELQEELTAFVTSIDPASQDRRWQLLHKTLQSLLRHVEHWAYVESSSESMSLEKAENHFEVISLTERQKIDEVLTNLNGNIQHRPLPRTLGEEETTFIVVTLILGTVDDNPLFTEIRTVEQLQAALKRLAAKRADYLRMVELLWTPQSPDRSLSFDEFVMDYPTMIKLV